MKRLLIYIALLVFPMLGMDGCLTENEEEAEEYPAGTYVVETIHGITVEEFSEKNSGYGLVFDWPLAIEFTNGLSDSTFTGEVKLAKLGWTPIENCTVPNCFILDVKGKLGPVESIGFGDIIINGNSMQGQFINTGPTLDVLESISFSATKK